MREALGPYRASIAVGRRRSLILLIAVIVGIFGAIAWGSYSDLRAQRRLLARLEDPAVTVELFRLQFGIGCAEGFPKGGPGPGGVPAPGPQETGPPPSEECQFIKPNGEPIGPRFTPDRSSPDGFGIPAAFFEQIRPELTAAQREAVKDAEKDLGPREVFQSRLRALGTFFGIAFIVLFGATFFGAEIRWGLWKSLLSHEPRRGRVLAAKLAGMWTFVLFIFLVALAIAAGVDAVMRTVEHVRASGGPSVAHLGKELVWAILPLELYATIAAALALSIRTSIAGIAALGFALGDHLLISKYHWMRHAAPTQQIAALLPSPPGIANGYAWFPSLDVGFACTAPRTIGGFQQCSEVILKPLPHWGSALILVAWTAAFAVAAWAVLRARDVPL